jgi:hypothetical protein
MELVYKGDIPEYSFVSAYERTKAGNQLELIKLSRKGKLINKISYKQVESSWAVGRPKTNGWIIFSDTWREKQSRTIGFT